MKFDGKWTVFSTIFFFRFVDGALQPARNSFLESDESSTVSDGNEEGYFEPADDRPFDNTTASPLYHYLLSDGDVITTAEKYPVEVFKTGPLPQVESSDETSEEMVDVVGPYIH